MATSLPPFPTNSQPGSFVWVDWFKKLEGFIIDVTDVSDSGTVTPGSIIIDGGPTGDATGYFQRIGNRVEFVLELTLTTSSTDPLFIRLGSQFPRALYRDTVTYYQAVSGTNRGVGLLDNDANRTISLRGVNIVGGNVGDPIIISGRYFSV